MSVKTKLWGWGFGLLGLGCVPLVTGVSAYAPIEPEVGTRYALEGPDPGRPGGDPRWPARRIMIERALAARGFQRDEASPQLLIQVSYGAGGQHALVQTHRTAKGAQTTHRVELADAYLRIEALDPASLATGDPRVLWSTLGEAHASPFDLDRLFPYMLASMEGAFGTSRRTRVDDTRWLWDAEAKRLSAP